MEDDAPITRDDAPFIRDEENEDRMQAIIYDRAAGPNSDGEDSGEQDDEDIPTAFARFKLRICSLYIGILYNLVTFLSVIVSASPTDSFPKTRKRFSS